MAETLRPWDRMHLSHFSYLSWYSGSSLAATMYQHRGLLRSTSRTSAVPTTNTKCGTNLRAKRLPKADGGAWTGLRSGTTGPRTD
ncbi:hypothetical protein [Streptomyces sp. NPDC000878]